jgi:hypothetical protein
MTGEVINNQLETKKPSAERLKDEYNNNLVYITLMSY